MRQLAKMVQSRHSGKVQNFGQMISKDLKNFFYYFKGQGKQKGTSKYIPGLTNPTKNL